MDAPLAISPFGVDFLKRQEGFTARPKWDYRQLSSGFGTKARYPGEVIDKPEAERRLLAETSPISKWLGENITVPLDQGKVDALTSFGYNLGVDDLERLKPDINAGAWDRVAARMPSWNKAGGQVNQGLMNRRAAEVALLTGKDPGSMATYYDSETPFLSPFGATTPQVRPAPIGGPSAGPPPAGGPVQLPPMPSGRYSKLADALMASAAGAKPTGWGSALNAFGDAALGYSLGSKADNEQKSYQSALSKALGGAADNDQLVQTMIASGDPQMVQQGVAAKIAMAKKENTVGRFRPSKQGVVDTVTGQIVPGTESKGTDNAEYGTTPIVVKGPDGKVRLGQMSKAGGIKYNDVDGEYQPGVDKIDTGTELQFRNKKTNELINTVQKDLSGKAEQTKLGEDRAAAKIMLPSVESTTSRLLDRLDRLETNPMRQSFTGWSGYAPNATPQANDYQGILDEVGGATFLQAFNNLRGGGAITEAEGAKATASLSRLHNTAPSDKGFLDALKDTRAVMNEIQENVRKRAGISGNATTPQSVAPPAANHNDPLGILGN